MMQPTKYTICRLQICTFIV